MKRLVESLWCRAIITPILGLLSGFLSNALIVDITVDSKIDWSLLSSQRTFWILLLLLALICLYQKAVFSLDKSTRKGISSDEYQSIIRDKSVEASAKRVIGLISKGNIEQLEKETAAFKRVFGEGD